MTPDQLPTSGRTSFLTEGTHPSTSRRTVEDESRTARRVEGTVHPAHHPLECIRITELLARIGDKWSVAVIGTLGEGPRRFNELRRALEGISQRMLSLTLRGLERDGLLNRKVTPNIPPRVDYTLTELGRSLLESVTALGDWAIANRTTVDMARQSYDNRADDG